MKRAGAFVGIVAVVLALAMVMPMVSAPEPIGAQSDVYALVQLPKRDTGEGLKAAVDMVFDATGKKRNVYAIIGCTQAQLDSLVASGYTVIEQRTGSEEECLDYLFELQDELAPPSPGHHTIIGPDPFGYYAIDSNETRPIAGPAYNWVEISGTGTPANIHCDDCNKWPVNIGFPFYFYGKPYTKASIGSNGLVYFKNAWCQFWNQRIPSRTTFTNTFMAVFWDDLDTWGPVQIYYQTLGRTSRQRMFVVEFCNIHRLAYVGAATFQVILFEDSNEILMQYKDVDFGDKWSTWGKSATVGIQGNRRTGLQYSYDSPIIRDGLAILFTPVQPLRSPFLQEQQGDEEIPGPPRGPR